MRVLIDISHPAHVHFYRHMRQRLVGQGAEVVVVARRKDVTVDLLDAFGIPYLVVGQSGHKGWLGQLGELLHRDFFLVRQGINRRPDVILTRNPSGVQAARMLGVTGVFDTDDGRSVGVHYKAAAPFAHLITAPDCLTESFGAKERRYPSYKSLAYLHPAVFEPDPTVRTDLGLNRDQPFAVVRLVAHDASHDRVARGIDSAGAWKIIRALEPSVPVFISAEGKLADALTDRRLVVPPYRIHDVLAAATVVIGDSQTVITEAALLGTPAVRVNTWARSSPHLTELEERYQLAYSFLPEELDRSLGLITEIIKAGDTEELWRRRRDRMLGDKVSLTDWYVDFVARLSA